MFIVNGTIRFSWVFSKISNKDGVAIGRNVIKSPINDMRFLKIITLNFI